MVWLIEMGHHVLYSPGWPRTCGLPSQSCSLTLLSARTTGTATLSLPLFLKKRDFCNSALALNKLYNYEVFSKGHSIQYFYFHLSQM